MAAPLCVWLPNACRSPECRQWEDQKLPPLGNLRKEKWALKPLFMPASPGVTKRPYRNFAQGPYERQTWGNHAAPGEDGGRPVLSWCPLYGTVKFTQHLLPPSTTTLARDWC